MTFIARGPAKLAAVAAVALLAACDQQPAPAPAPPPVAYNPPSPALAQTPQSEIGWYQVTFGAGSAQIDAYGRGTIGRIADAMQADPGLIATIVGKADTVGNDANNMRLAKLRADAVHNALLRTGKVTEARLDTRWTGSRPEGARPMVAGADVSNRVVDIALHK
jgi:outer membrane protein OmpA-like peptidoglycan-associated protein